MRKSRVCFWLVIALWVGISAKVSSTLALSDGFDLPVGKPDGAGYQPSGYDFLDWIEDFNAYHPGEDWNGIGGGDTDYGDSVYAVSNGTVVASDYYVPFWGNIVLIEHNLPDGSTVWSQYAHLKDRTVQTGNIEKGDLVGTIGKGGQEQFPAHLHFEIRKEYRAPDAWVEGWNEIQIQEYYCDPSDYINSHRQFALPTRFQDNSDGTITDLSTGLTWPKDANSAATNFGATTTQQGAIIFISQLNATGGFAGHTDWRIPNYKELSSIIDYNKTAPTVYGTFDNINPNKYWTSSRYLYQLPEKYRGWYVDFSTGETGIALYMQFNNPHFYYFLPVRGPESQPSLQATGIPSDTTGCNLGFQDNGNNTKTDLCTGLMWTNTLTGIGYTDEFGEEGVVWQAAMLAAQQEHFGYSDWRLPNIREILNVSGLLSGGSSAKQLYWSTTPDYFATNYIWYVNLWANPGQTTTGPGPGPSPNQSHYVILVRNNVYSSNQPPDQPINILPVNGATGVALTPTLEASLFSDSDPGDIHTACQWQVTTIPGHYILPAAYLFDSGVDTQNLAQIDIPSGELEFGTTYYWHVRHRDNSDADNKWSEWSEETSFTTIPSFGCAILATAKGGAWYTHSFDFLIDIKASKAYKSLRNLGFHDIYNPNFDNGLYDRICYLNSEEQDADDDGDNDVDAPSSSDNLEKAITEWALERAKPPGLLILYMVGHGDETKGYMNFSHEDGVSGWELNQWIADFSVKFEEQFSEEAKILVVVDACYSGSFITDSFMSISAANRIILTSTPDDEKLKGLYNWFGYSFFNQLEKGESVLNAFVEASSIPDVIIGEPWLDDNGDKKGHPSGDLQDDGIFAANMIIGEPSTVSESQCFESGTLSSPGEIRVYDSEGRVTGLVDGQVKEEIPNSIYINETEDVIIFPAVDSYYYKVTGTDAGTYGIKLARAIDEAVVTFTATDIPTATGAVHQYTIDWDALSQGKEGVTVQLDFDGDGTFELTITTGSSFLSVSAIIDFDPDTLSLTSAGKWGTCYIELPEDYNVEDIVSNTVRLWTQGSEILAEEQPIAIGDYDADGIPDLMLKFSRSTLMEILRSAGHTGDVTLTVNGQITDVVFQGTDVIRVIDTLAAPSVPTVFALLQNFSNPFNPDTWIPYQLAEDVDVTIRIYSAFGRLIRTLDLGHKPAGFYTDRAKAAYWDGRNEPGEHVASGIYFYIIQAGEFSATKKMVVAK